MRKIGSAIALVIGLAPLHTLAQASGTAGFDLDDFQLRTTQDLLDICTVEASSPNYNEAQAFCFGYLAGGKHFHDAIVLGEEFAPITCPGERVTRGEAIGVIVAYIRANPQYLNEPPMETVFRAAADKWPCKP